MSSKPTGLTGIAAAMVGGGFAGAVATGPMTAVMALAQKLVPQQKQAELPPKRIGMSMFRRATPGPQVDEQKAEGFAWAAHLGYGAGMGGLYGPVSCYVPGPGALKGTVFGALVWVVSYFAGLPLFNLPEQGQEQTPQRHLTVLASHLVWGATLGTLAGLAIPSGKDAADTATSD